MKKKIFTKKYIGAIVGIILGIIIMILPPPSGLTAKSMIVFGILVWSIFWWIFKVIPDFAVALLMNIFFLLFCDVDSKTTFGFFSGSTWWLLLGAFGIGAGISNSGVLRRIALKILKLFKPTYRGQITGLAISATVVSPFIPSLAGKNIILTPLAGEINDFFGFKDKSKAGAGLFLAMFTSLRTMAPVLMCADIVGYAFLDVFPEEINVKFTLGYWFLCMLPFTIVVLILNTLVLNKRYGGENNPSINKKTLRQKSEELGKITRHEKIALTLTILAIAFWATESIHGIPAYIISLVTFILMITTKVLPKEKVRTGINWEMLIFIGCIASLSNVIHAEGIDTWMIAISKPMWEFLSANYFITIVGLGILMIIMRFFILSEVALVGIVMPFLVTAAPTLNMSPWVAGVIIYVMMSPWFMAYQNTYYLSASGAINGRLCPPKEMTLYCLYYQIINVVGLCACLPLWKYLGLVF